MSDRLTSARRIVGRFMVRLGRGDPRIVRVLLTIEICAALACVADAVLTGNPNVLRPLLVIYPATVAALAFLHMRRSGS